VGRPLSAEDRSLAGGYARSLELPAGIAAIDGWEQAEQVTRDPRSGDGWWEREETERRALMAETAGRIGDALLLETLTSAVEAGAGQTHAGALAAGGSEAMARVASGAALMALNNRALALLAGRGDEHPFVQKYALFAAGRWPLGVRGETFLIF
jgi:hypothetical protein